MSCPVCDLEDEDASVATAFVVGCFGKAILSVLKEDESIDPYKVVPAILGLLCDDHKSDVDPHAMQMALMGRPVTEEDAKEAAARWAEREGGT